MLIASVCLGAYSTSNIEIMAGGFGYDTASNNKVPYQETWIDKAHPFTLGDGSYSLTKIKLRGTNLTTPGCTTLKVKVFRENGSDLELVGESDIAGEGIVAYSVIDGTLGTPITGVQNGDFIGFYLDGQATAYIRAWTAEAGTTGQSDYWHQAGDITTTTATATWTDDATGNDPLEYDVWFEGNDFVFHEITSPTIDADGEQYDVPLYWGTTEAFYYIFEDVVVPEGDTLEITWEVSDVTSGVVAQETLEVSFDGGANDEEIGFNSFGTSKSLVDVDSGNQSGDTFDIYFLYDRRTAYNPNSADVLFVNRTQGQYSVSPDSNIKYISVTDGEMSATWYNSNYRFKRLKLVSDAAGATIGKIIVCRKPVLAVADSFVAGQVASNPPVVLDNVGAYLGAAFTKKRHIINAGIMGGKVAGRATNGTNFFQRWGDSLRYFDDVIVAYVNGPGLNNINEINSDQATADSLLIGITGTILESIYEAQALGNDVVMTEMVQCPAYTALENSTIVELNTILKYMAWKASVPFAESYYGFNDFDGDNVHPDDTGSSHLADELSAAYENNTYPTTNPEGSSPFRFRNFP